MKIVNNARDLLQEGETAMVIFTRGPQLVKHADGTGTTGNWKMTPRIDVDWLVIYLRKADGSNKIYRAKPVAVRSSIEDGRSGIEFASLQLMGQTTASWYQFAATQANPVRYLQK